MQIHCDIPYVSDHAALQTLDLYVPDSATAKHPLVVYIHGGAWRSGDKSESSTLAKGLVELSRDRLAVAVINYRLSVRGDPATMHPMHLNDTVSAVEFLVAGQYPGSDRVDTGSVYLVGHSAGAQLAGALVLQEHVFALGRRIRGVVGVGGIYNLDGLLQAYPSYSDFVDMAFAKDQYGEASPYVLAENKLAEAAHIRFLVANSTTDELIGSDQAAQFAGRLVGSGYEDVTLVVRDMGTHFGQLDDRRFWQIVVDFVL
ncbi:hypothetical protein EC988_000518 [Linderina pennispora]|nr:hypothetical protein EC988_000518 [Linderina pennispora]